MIERERILETLIVVFLAVFGGAARFALTPPREKTLGAVASSLVIAGFAGILAWQVLDWYGCPPQAQAAGAGIAGLIGDDMLRGIMAMGRKFSSDPLSFIERWKGGGKRGE